MPDWYRDVDPHVGPDGYPEQTYLDWAQAAGARVDAAGNVIWPDQEDRGIDDATES